MIQVRVSMRVGRIPLKRVPVVLELDADGRRTAPVLTDRAGVAGFDEPPASGKVLVDGIERYHGRLDGEIGIELWSITESEAHSEGTPAGFTGGSNAYPDMQTRIVRVGGREVLTDSEGYLVDPDEWTEAFARAQAQSEGLALTDEHWQLIRYLRAHFEKHGAQASVRDMIAHFRPLWGRERASNRYLHRLFPRGGPQKQGNRLAGLLRTKGEH